MTTFQRAMASLKAFREGKADRGPKLTELSENAKDFLLGLEELRASVPLNKIREAVGVGGWDSIMLDAMNKRLQRGWEAQREEHVWTKLVSTRRNVKDFRTQYTIQLGDFTTLDSIAPQMPYYQTWFSDDRASWAPSKYGKMFCLSFEEMRNDDLQVFNRLLEMFARAQAETVEKFVVYTNLDQNPTLYDSISLFHSSHSNVATSAELSQPNLETGLTAIRTQTDMDGNPLNIKAKYLLVHPDEEWTARRLIESPQDPTTGNRAVNVHHNKLEILVSTYVTSGSWYLIADPNRIETFELGFLDGREAPEVWEEPGDTGTSFTRDVKRYKCRSVFGGCPIDYRPFYKGSA